MRTALFRRFRSPSSSGVSASIAFQYYRPQPLWIPISWNAVFLLINVGMAGLLLKEESDAKQQDEDTATIYDKVPYLGQR